MNLIEDRDIFIARLIRLTPDAKPRWGRMNANQMICHCSDALRGALGELDGKVDQSNFLTRTVLKLLILHVIPVPKGVPTSERTDQVDGNGTPPTAFDIDRSKLIELIERFAAAPRDFAWSWHFRFGKMNRDEWAKFSAKHLDHHLRQFGV